MSDPHGTREGLDGTEVAICGLAGRFPGASDVARFWQNLCDGVESITRFTAEELREAGEDPARIADPRYVPARPVLEGVELFDAPFFGFSRREAEILDPQHRMFLEVAWEALEDAGYDTARLDGAVSLFAGASFSNYLVRNLYENRPVMESYGDMLATIQNVPDSLSTMAAYKLGLKGPCCAVQTFCSTSLVAVHLACQSLLSLESDVALAGGVSIYVPQKSGYLHEEGSIVSSDGRCRAFDAGANGTVFGNGVGVVVLRRLEDALRAGDAVRAVILGSAVNNDGPVKASFAAPAVVGQTEVVVEALASAGVSPESISCVEAHGTGTPLGDPAEVTALTRAFRTGTARRGYCALGSVKTNVGHLDAAAGVTGLIKLVLSLENRRIPQSLHFETPNPEIDFASSPFYVNTKLREWPSEGTPRRAGVSAFGVGGTNAHVVLEEAPEIEAGVSSRPAQLLVLSARSEAALEQLALRLARHLEEHPGLTLADVAWTLQTGRRAFERRRAAICRGREDALRVLRGEAPSRWIEGAAERREPPVALRFPTAGAPSPPALGQLCAVEPRLREEIDAVLASVADHESRLRTILDGAAAPDDRWGAAAGVVVQCALARTVLSWGIRPEALVAEGEDESAARVVAGQTDLPATLEAVISGSRPPIASGAPEGLLVSRAALGGDASRVTLEIPASPAGEALLEAQRVLWLGGVELDWAAVHSPERRRRVSLPTYPFERQRCWVDPLPEEGSERGPADWVYRPLWKSALPAVPREGQRHLLFLDGGELGLGLAGRLRALGDSVVTVSPGPAFAGDPGEGYRIDPGRAEDYVRLWADLARLGGSPHSVVHLWCLGASDSSGADADERLEVGLRMGFDSLRHLARAITGVEGPPVALRAVTSGLHVVLGHERPSPEWAPALGLLRVLPQEHEDLRCAAVDVDTAADEPGSLVETLAREVRSRPGDPVVALRRGRRWVQGYELLHERPEGSGLVVREGGVYVVTGGLGSVGFVHAVALARRTPVKLALVGRVALPPREQWDAWLESHDASEPLSERIRKVRALETLGSEVRPVVADVTDEGALGRALAIVQQSLGPPNGLVHAAGELASETFLPVRDLSKEALARQFGAKVRGLLLLERLLRGQELDFVLLTSSLSTVLGGYGYAAYAAANAYLDALAEARTGQGGSRWLAVGWDLWATGREDVGDAPALTPRQGLDTLETLLGRPEVSRLVVSGPPLEPRLRRWVALEDEVPDPDRRAESVPGSEARGTAADEDAVVASVEQALLGHEAVTSAAVLARRSAAGPPSLEAFVTFGRGAEPTVTELRSWLKQRLSPERVPASFVVLDALPLTSEGAPDRSALTRLGVGGEGNGAHSPPRTGTERRLAAIWQETLGREAVSVGDNFFDLGGHSLLSVRVVARVEKELGVRLDPRDLIFQSLEQLAASCEARLETAEESR